MGKKISEIIDVIKPERGDSDEQRFWTDEGATYTDGVVRYDDKGKVKELFVSIQPKKGK